MFNGLGLVQRNAVPVSFLGGGDVVPLSVDDPTKREQWTVGREAQRTARAEFAEAVVAACKKIDTLAQVETLPDDGSERTDCFFFFFSQTLPALKPVDPEEFASLQQQLDAREQQLTVQLERLQALAKRVREEKTTAIRAVVEVGRKEDDESTAKRQRTDGAV